MNHAVRVRVAECIQHLPGVCGGGARRQRAALQNLRQRSSVNELHHHHQLVTGTHGRVQFGNIGMIERCLHLDLIQEAVRQAGIAFEIRQQDFHGFDAVRKNIADLVDLAHPARAQDLDNFVVANAFADVHVHSSGS